MNPRGSNGHDTGTASRIELLRKTPVEVSPTTAFDELELLTTEELAHLWKTTPERIRDLTRKEGLLFFRVGRYIRFRERDVLAWLESRRSTSESGKTICGRKRS